MIPIPHYSATQLYPSNIQIDATVDNIFTWNSSDQTDYQLKIYKNSDNSIIFDSLKQTSSNQSHTIPASTLTNGILYKWQLQTWNSALSAKSQFVIFSCYANPTFALGSLPTNSQVFEFSALYNSTESIPIKWYQFKLYLSSDTDNPIDESDIIYPDTLVHSSASPLIHVFDGLSDDTTFKVRAIGENQLGYSLDTGLSPDFTINYSYPPSVPTLQLISDNTNGSIALDWASLKVILGKIYGTSSFVTGKFDDGLQINSNSYLYYDTENITNDYTIYTWIKLSSGYNGIVLQVGEDNENGMKLTYKNGRFGFDIGSYTTCGRLLTLSEQSEIESEFVLIGIKYGQVIIKSTNFQETISMT